VYKLQFFYIYICCFITRFKRALLSFYTANALKMNMRNQAHKPVNKKCSYWGPIFETEWSRGSNFVSRCRDVAIFRLFKMANAAILDFSNFKLLTVGRLKRAELHRCAKFGQNRSKRGRDMAIFQFLKMAASAILDF